MSYTGIKEILLKGNQKPFLKRFSQGKESRVSYNFLSGGQRIRFLSENCNFLIIYYNFTQ